MKWFSELRFWRKGFIQRGFNPQMRNVKWQNAHNVEKKFNPRKPGKWLADQISLEKGQN